MHWTRREQQQAIPTNTSFLIDTFFAKRFAMHAFTLVVAINLDVTVLANILVHGFYIKYIMLRQADRANVVETGNEVTRVDLVRLLRQGVITNSSHVIVTVL